MITRIGYVCLHRRNRIKGIWHLFFFLFSLFIMTEELHAEPSHQPSTLMYDVSLELHRPQQMVIGLNLWQQERCGRMAVSATSFPWAGPR